MLFFCFFFMLQFELTTNSVVHPDKDCAVCLFTALNPPHSDVCVGNTLRTWRDFADRGRMPAVALVTVGALDKDGAVTETLGKYFSSDVVQPHTTALTDRQKQKKKGKKKLDENMNLYLPND